MCREVRDLRADEIDVRVQSIKMDFNSNCKGAVLLLYKNARVDMDILDETFGRMNWQRHHEFKDGKLYCTVSVWDDEKKQWISREDVGTESNTEAEKGQASDSFKRANVNFGVGRELYTAPFTYIKASDFESIPKKKQDGTIIGYSTNDTFSVAEIEIKNKIITGLAIRNDKSKQIVFTFGNVSQNKQQNKSESKTPKQQHQENANEPKTSPQKPQITYEQALEVVYEGRTLKEIYKAERNYVSTVYELGSEEIKEAITVIEAYLAQFKAKKNESKA